MIYLPDSNAWIAYLRQNSPQLVQRFLRAAQGTLIGPNDLMIASIALASGLILVTHNTREFGRVPGLKLEDWQ